MSFRFRLEMTPEIVSHYQVVRVQKSAFFGIAPDAIPRKVV